MQYREIDPSPGLALYIKCYYIYQSDSDSAFEDTVFPSGCMELIFNLGSGSWKTHTAAGFLTNPPVELWGQLIHPLPIRSLGKNTMLGVRFLPDGAAGFLSATADDFNDRIFDFRLIAGRNAGDLHQRLLETSDWPERIGLIETFLLNRLSLAKRKTGQAAVVRDIMGQLRKEDFFENIGNVASRYGISQRYLQRLFLHHTGLTPKLYSKIHRFQNSLRLVTRKDTSLTSIAYDCGYFDQSHFIRDFKAFTGRTPSGYLGETSPITSAITNQG